MMHPVSKIILSLATLFVLGISFIAPAHATGSGTGGSTGGGTTTSTGGGGGTTTTSGSDTTTGAGSASCDFSAMKASLSGTESGGNYAAICRNKGAECLGGARGKYQFIRTTRSSYIKRYPACKGSACDSDEAWISSACHGVQECIMDAYLSESLDRLKKEPACQQLLKDQSTFTGTGQGKTLSCKPTESGLLGAMHLGGNGKATCQKILAGKGGSSDELKTSLTYYMCKHGGKPVPGSCTPAAYDSNMDQPVATQQQLDTMQSMGIPVDDQVGGPADPLKEWWVAGLMLMAEQFTANMEAQVKAIGMLFDAKHQLETQRLFQEKQARAHKDYHPSEQMCTFGTFARDLAATERSSDLTKIAISQNTLQRELHIGTGKAADGVSDSLSRIAQFRKKFCEPGDNANGLKHLCPNTPPGELRNADINFTTTLDQPMSLKINMTDTETTTDEEAVFALVDNLFMHDPLPVLPKDELGKRNYQYHYLNMRSIVAMRGIARNSIANIIALKTATPNKDSGTAAPFMRALFREFGLQEDEIKKLLGDNPSYYAQMDLLTKKIYQSPGFYNNLYDKPANVERVRAAMTAIKLMQDRDIQASLQRREMLLSMILEIRLRERAEDVYNATERAMYAR